MKTKRVRQIEFDNGAVVTFTESNDGYETKRTFSLNNGAKSSTLVGAKRKELRGVRRQIKLLLRDTR